VNDVAVVNEESSACANGKRASSCAVDSFDFKAIGVSGAAATALEGQVRSGQAIVAGTLKLVAVPLPGSFHEVDMKATLTVSSAWVAPSENVALGNVGTFQIVTKNVASCGAINQSHGGEVTCDPYRLVLVNKNTESSAPAIDLTDSAASDDVTSGANTALHGNGLLTFGYLEGTAQGPKTYEVTAFFLPVNVDN
jgi:hypothetical protein